MREIWAACNEVFGTFNFYDENAFLPQAIKRKFMVKYDGNYFFYMGLLLNDVQYWTMRVLGSGAGF